MRLGLGSGLGSGNSPPRYVTGFFNGFELPGSTYSGGPVTTEDNTGALVTSPAGVLPITGGRLTDGVWYPTDLSGDPIRASTPLRTRKGTVSKYAESYKGALIEPARTNLFLNSTDPVTQDITTTAQKYTITVKGTGDITVSGTATGTATEGSPLTVTATAGTMTCTVTGTLSRVNVEAGAFGTSFIDTGATTITRPAANLTRATAGSGLESGNDFAIYGRVVPKAAGQLAYIASLYIDASNWFAVYAADSGTNLRLGKVVAGAAQIVNSSGGYTHAANTPFEYLAYQHSVHGMGIAVKEDGGEWSAWATNADTQNAPIASTYQIGARNNANHFAGNFPFTEIISIPASVNPQTWLMDQLEKGRI